MIRAMRNKGIMLSKKLSVYCFLAAVVVVGWCALNGGDDSNEMRLMLWSTGVYVHGLTVVRQRIAIRQSPNRCDGNMRHHHHYHPVSIITSSSSRQMIMMASSPLSSSSCHHGARMMRGCWSRCMTITTTPMTPPALTTTTTMRMGHRRRGGVGVVNARRVAQPLSLSTTSSLSADDSNSNSDDSSNNPITDSGVETTNITTTVAAASFGLIKAMIGTGVLALPSGLAAITDHKAGLWPANVLLLTLGGLSAYTFALYGRLTHSTQANSLSDLWQRVQQDNNSNDSKNRISIISVATFSYCFGICLMYQLVISDTLSGLLSAAGVPGLWSSRPFALLSSTMAVLFPLSNLNSLSSLAPVSLVGVLGSMICTVFIACRCPALIPSSPYRLGGGRYVPTLPPNRRPQFGLYNRMHTTPASSLILVAMGCTALLAHFSAPDFYLSLRGKNSNETSSSSSNSSSTMNKFQTMTWSSFAIVAAVNAITLTCGFLTFGGNSAGIILNNYAAADIGAALSRALVLISVMGGFPFILGPCRTAGLELYQALTQKATSTSTKSIMTFSLFGVLTGIALVVQDAGFVAALNGALMGTAIAFTFPALLFLKHTTATVAIDGVRQRRLIIERWFCRFVVGFGVLSGLIGAAVSVMNYYFPHLLA